MNEALKLADVFRITVIVGFLEKAAFTEWAS